MAKFYLDCIENEKSYITPELVSIFKEVISEAQVDSKDFEYLWALHCNMNMRAVDKLEGLRTHDVVRASTEFILQEFGVDISLNPQWWNTYCFVEPPPVGEPPNFRLIDNLTTIKQSIAAYVEHYPGVEAYDTGKGVRFIFQGKSVDFEFNLDHISKLEMPADWYGVTIAVRCIDSLLAQTN